MIIEVMIDLPEELHERLTSLAEKLGKSPSELMLEAIENRPRELETGSAQEV